MSKKTRRPDDPAPPARIKLDPMEFWKVRALLRDTEVIVAEAQAHVNQAIATRDAYVAELATKYGFDPKADQYWQWNDDTCEIALTRQ